MQGKNFGWFYCYICCCTHFLLRVADIICQIGAIFDQGGLGFFSLCTIIFLVLFQRPFTHCPIEIFYRFKDPKRFICLCDMMSAFKTLFKEALSKGFHNFFISRSGRDFSSKCHDIKAILYTHLKKAFPSPHISKI